MARNRKRGRTGPNLKRDNGTIINQYGVKINEDEARRLRNLVQRVNRKRDKMLQQFKDKPLYYGTQRLDASREQLMLMGDELDLIIKKRSTSVNRFQSKREFNSYMNTLEKVMKTDYIEHRAKVYKKNLMTRLKEQYGMYPDLLKGVLMRIQMMKIEDFATNIGSDQIFQIKNHYGLYGQLQTLKALREKLGLSNPDYDEDEEY